MPFFRIQYPIEALDGGLNNKYEETQLEDSESPDCANVVFDDTGGAKTRGGSSKFNTTAVGSFAGDGLFTARFDDGTEQMLGCWNGSMFKLTGTSTFTTVPSAQSVFTTGTRVDAAMYQNIMFFGNGGSKPYKYNGTEFTRHGIPQPNSGPTVSSGTAAADRPPTGDINYKVGYVNSYVTEGDVSAATTTITVATSASISIVCLPLAPTSFGVASRKLYRKDSTTAGSYKLVTTIADNTTTTYLDETAGASLGATAPTDNGEPPNWKYITAHQERLWMVTNVDPDYLYYSDLGAPFTVDSTNYEKISDGDGENVTGIFVHANNIIIGKDASVWALYLPDSTPGNWLKVKTNSKYGLVSHYATAGYSQLQMFMGKRYTQLTGFYALAGTNTKPNATDLTVTGIYSDSQSDKIEPDIFNIPRAYAQNSCAIEYKNKLWFSVPYTGQTVNSRVYQFDFQRRDEDQLSGSWVPFTYPQGFAAFTVYGGVLYGQSSTAHGFVFRLDTTSYIDGTTAIDSYIWTKEFVGHEIDIENQKDFRWLNLVVEPLGSYYMSVSYKINASDTTTKQIDLTALGPTWGTSTWNGTTWDSGIDRVSARVALSPSTGKKVQFKFSNQNTASQGFHVYGGLNLFYNKRGLR